MGLKLLGLFSLLFLCCEVKARIIEGDCEVCVSFLSKLDKGLQDSDRKNIDALERELINACKSAKGKDERFCYYIGASETSATKLVNSVTKPLSYNKPVEKICHDLKKKDGEICSLRYDKEIDFSTVDLKKLKVKELKKILIDWGEQCRGCAEKTDFISKIESVKHQHVEL